ncbi:Histidine kinase [Rhodovastum atsumiense]|uniref:histidine kinase n=1 Tax=Rhodovastum atsumiense TaxID=504468 RepID=A0A5M6IRF6_9PROT|nr:PAS domain S-box protein [Rhodovastum atsumiense]KAA5610873.1 PAS domain S-box protein [Rhodovastum atsumiense]CAH2602070.1 Histidine kinase [Rhodovastum atsumiense]
MQPSNLDMADLVEQPSFPRGPAEAAADQAGETTRPAAGSPAPSATTLPHPRCIHDPAGIGIWEFDLVNRTITWSPGQYRLHGLDPASAVPSFEQWLACIEPEDRPLILAAEATLQESGASPPLEFRIRRADDGACRRLASLSHLVTDPAGRPLRIIGINLDITDRHRTTETLHQTEALLRAIGHCSPDLIYAKDIAGRYLFANPAALAVYDLPADAVLGRTDLEWHHAPDQAAALMANDRRIIETGRAEVIEELFNTPGQPVRIYRSAKAPLRMEDGRVAGTVGVSSDITQVKATEAALRGSEERFRMLFEQAAVGIAEVGLDGRWIGANDRLCGMLGYRRDELLAKTVAETTHPDDLAADLAGRRRLLAGELASVIWEKRYLCKDGSILWTNLATSLMRDQAGTPQHFIGVVQDISARKRIEAGLREGEERFRRLFDTAPLPSYVVDPATFAIIDCNEAAARMLGHDRAVLRHMHIADIDALMDEVTMHVSRDAALRGLPYQFETRHRTRAGELRDVLVALVPFDLAGRRLSHCTVIDITERKRAEAELRALTTDLAARVRAEVAAREAAQARAAHAERLQALGRLAGGIAHDFNNILQAVQAGTGLIEHRAGDPASVRRFARTLLNAAQRGAAITRRLLAFARRDELQAEPIDPAALLSGLRDVLAHTLGSSVTVGVAINHALPALLADKGQLETVLVNLATNARDAMPEGGTLTLAAATETVGPEATHPAGLGAGTYVRFAVIDTGSGMEGTTLARACEPFFTTKPPEQGTGLGLSMAQGFAGQSGGALAIDSTPGQGTTVMLWLPAAEREPAWPEAEPGPAPRERPERRVLIVDDEDMLRETLAAGLEDAGFGVMTAPGGAAALRLLDTGAKVDVLISDLSMPGMGGLALIEEARRRRPGLPALLFTGYADEATHRALTAGPAGAFVLLGKPATIAQITGRVEALLAAGAQVATG